MTVTPITQIEALAERLEKAREIVGQVSPVLGLDGHHVVAEWKQDHTVEVVGNPSPLEKDGTLADALELHDQAKAEMDRRISGYNQITKAVDASLVSNVIESSVIKNGVRMLSEGKRAPIDWEGEGYELVRREKERGDEWRRQ